MTDSLQKQLPGEIGEALLEDRTTPVETLTFFDTLFDAIPDIIGIQDVNHRIIRYNEAGYRFLNMTHEDVVGKKCYELFGWQIPCSVCATSKCCRSKKPERVEKVLEEFGITLDVRSYPVLDSDGNIIYIIEHFRDITEHKDAEDEKKQLKEQLLQSKKIESIGRLAGGIAHDFNNLLSPILGYTEFLLSDFHPDSQHYEDLSLVLEAAVRAKNLTQQLLAFGRKQLMDLKPIDLREVIVDFHKLLRRTIREDIRIEIKMPQTTGLVNADISQIDQVLLNLAVNAQDAMPDGGVLTIQLEDAPLVLDEITELPDGMAGSSLLLLTVTDTGCGMDKQMLDSIFEPFYTNKSPGKGTGLGLSTVYGIVSQHGGHIRVYSELGEGTTFKIYLPEVDGPTEIINTPAEDLARLTGQGETILVVEDEEVVRDLTSRILERQGYKVISAESPERCFAILETLRKPIDLLLTDVVLPDMNGKELFESLHARLTDLKVVYMSGYTTDIIAHRDVLKEHVHFIQKPFSSVDLAKGIKDALKG